jgi:hypothetical protein
MDRHPIHQRDREMDSQQLKLRIDPVPETCWGKNLRTQIGRSQWDKLREKLCADQGNACCICGGSGKLHCHEAWRYNDKGLVQQLTGFHAVCGMCHHVTHFGLAQILADQGQLDLKAVIEQFMTVNGVSREAFESHKTETFRVWRDRSKCQWRTDLGEWAALIQPNRLLEPGEAARP